jgi:hypothetical protein
MSEGEGKTRSASDLIEFFGKGRKETYLVVIGLDVHVFVRLRIVSVSEVEVDGREVLVVLLEKVESGEDSGSHVVDSRLGHRSVLNSSRQVLAKVRCVGVESDVSGHLGK